MKTHHQSALTEVQRSSAINGIMDALLIIDFEIVLRPQAHEYCH
ncbi:hypothetical protein PECL_1835 [Pediococcus claussenii ATCC BAA-344]|uniref:Uncharacterized protein n=1 Tax=Pediococcus claussenii (strain ATCC BAA-344 / DSM 14800 / JCM 18046 / KCTC 3811 / LMG 21948 / P06) TaxID=701521 RepID=G8PC68_PEDCP|nr:hypothetical protein PECL_1835 [Pediococcus claussenii ATCC BAA-344]